MPSNDGWSGTGRRGSSLDECFSSPTMSRSFVTCTSLLFGCIFNDDTMYDISVRFGYVCSAKRRVARRAKIFRK